MVYNLFIHQVGSIGRLSLADIERLAVFSLGRTLSSAASHGLRSVQPLLAAMCSHQLSMVPRLLDVLSEVERHWRQEVGEMRTFCCCLFCIPPGGSQPSFSVGRPAMSPHPWQGTCSSDPANPVPSIELLLLLRLHGRPPLLLVLLPAQTSPGHARHRLSATQLDARPAGG